MQGKYNESIEMFEKCLALNAEFLEALTNKGIAL